MGKHLLSHESCTSARCGRPSNTHAQPSTPASAPNIQTMGTWAPMHDSKLCRKHCTLVGCGASRAARKEGRSQLPGRKGDRSEVIADCAIAGWACGSLEGYGSRWMATDIIPKERFQYLRNYRNESICIDVSRIGIVLQLYLETQLVP